MKIMRLQVLLIAAATLLLASCGGKSTNNKADAANDSGKTATTADALAGHFEYAIGNVQGSKFLIITNREQEACVNIKGADNVATEKMVDVKSLDVQIPVPASKYVTAKLIDNKLANTYAIAYYAGKQYHAKYEGMQTGKHNSEKDGEEESEEDASDDVVPVDDAPSPYFLIDEYPGFVYNNLDKNFFMREEESVPGIILLADATFAKNYQLVTDFKYGKDGMVPSIKAEIQKKYNRKIVKSTVIATFGNGCEFDSFQFENVGNNALAICVLKTEKGCSIIEYPATYDRSADYSSVNPSVWHADDFDVFNINYDGGGDEYLRYAVNCIFKTATGYSIFIEDNGPGEISAFFLRQAGDKLIEENLASFHHSYSE
jgi:hypothetical protein